MFLSVAAGAATTSVVYPVAAWSRPLPNDQLAGLTLEEASVRLRQHDVSPVELTQACLARIERYDSRVNAFITVAPDLALDQARAAEREIHRGRRRGPLHGIPIALKDNIDTAGLRTTAASAVFVDRVPTEDAEVVRRLKAAGVVLLGKLNMTEFASDFDSISSYFGAIHNPWSLEHEAGGSSGGSAAAVAANFCFGALGTDTAGSVRTPASFCGVVGLKPSYGLVSNRGVIPSNRPLDHVGPLGRTVRDTALLLQGVAGHDPGWEGSANVSVPGYEAALEEPFQSPQLGVPRPYFFDNLDPQIAEVFDAALEVMRTFAAGIRDDVVVPTHLDTLRALDIAERLAFHERLFEHTPGLYQPALRRSLARMGDAKPVSGADYVNARQALHEARRHAARVFDGVDLLVMPTWKQPPMTLEASRSRLGSGGDHPPALANTLPFNVLGVPAITVPCGFTRQGLPVGAQIAGRPFMETQVLAFAHRYEQATKWHLQTPDL